MIKTLAIETSCDDTSIAIVCFDWKSFFVEKIFSYSQVEKHKDFGGVVPEVASRLHNEKAVSLIEKIWEETIKETDFISVTACPWLPGSLLVGKTVANMLWEIYNKKVINVDHIYWHIFSVLLDRDIFSINFPVVVLTVSGGHNDIYLIDKKKDFTQYLDFDCFDISKIWSSIDDAAGEAFDKVAKMLWWPYPWGEWIYENASFSSGNEQFKLKRVFLSKDKYDFSFSWVKSKIYYLLRDLEAKNIKIKDKVLQDICFEFQESVVEVLTKKAVQAMKDFWIDNLRLTWWVSSNDRLYEYIRNFVDKKGIEGEILRPSQKIYSTDNAAMIGVVGILQGKDSF